MADSGPHSPEDDSERQLLAQLVAGVHVGLCVWELGVDADPAGLRLIHANPAASAATGIDLVASTGKTIFEILPSSAVVPVIAEVATGGRRRSWRRSLRAAAD